MSQQTPSVGRLVHYHGPGNALPAGHPGHFEPVTYPAVVTGVHGETEVDLFVMTRLGFMNLQRVLLGGPQSPGSWSWPPHLPAKPERIPGFNEAVFTRPLTSAERVAFAAQAYAAYGEATGGKNFAGQPMPQWDELPERIRAAWIAAAERVARLARDLAR